jgi:hypothetical protein
MAVSTTDRSILRELAGQVAEIAALPVQQETIRLWKALNGRKPVRPMVMIDQVCWHEMDVEGELALRCEDPFCRGLETRLRRTLYSWRHMRADMVVEPFIDIHKAIRNTGFGLGVVEQRVATDARNDVVSHHYEDQLRTEADLAKIRDPEISLDEAATAEAEEKAHAIFDGLLGVRMQGAFPVYAPFDIIVCWRGAEPLLYDMADRPEFVHAIVRRLTEAQLRMLDQLEAQGLMGTDQGTIHCTGAYTDELAALDPRSARGLWTFGMSQIFSTVSPSMHEEFEGPYLTPWFNRFGMAYYGCCEPLDKKLPMIRKLPKVRKVSMSPWVDAEYGAGQIGGDFVFSRKPSPAFLAVDAWNPAAVERDLQETLDACARHGCPVELILKDISTVRYQPQRLWEWAETARRLVGA